MSAETSRRERRSSTRGRRRRRRIIIWSSVAVVVLALAGSAAWVVSHALTARAELEQARTLLGQVTADAKAYDFEALQESAAAVGEHAAAAADATSGPVWRAAELIPWAGQNLLAVRVVAESIDSIVSDVAVPAAAAVASIDPAAKDPATGGFDLAPLTEATRILSSASTTIDKAQAQLNGIDRGAVIGEIGTVLDAMDEQLSEADALVADADHLLTFASAMLGVDRPRTNVLMFQNNAESTALGGSAASYTVIQTDRGSINVVDQATSRDFTLGVPVDVPVDASAIDVYSSYLVDHLNTATSRPDFPTAASIASAYFVRDRGLTPDGVISIDPLAMARIIGATGPITLPSGDVLTEENVVRLLVNEIYFRYSGPDVNALSDAFFAQTAQTVLDTVKAGNFDLKAMIGAVQSGIDTGSIMAWSADPALQSLLDGQRLQGRLPADNTDSTVIGVYYRDISASKIDYYLSTATRTTSDTCTAPDAPTFTTTVTLHSNLTPEEATALPAYIRSGNYGRQLFVTQVFIYGPVGGSVASLSQDQAMSARGASDLGRPVAVFNVALTPGESRDVAVTFTGAPGSYGDLEVRGTPMINKTEVAVEPSTCG